MAPQTEPTDMVRSYYRYVDAESYDELLGLFAEDIAYHRPGHEPLEGMDDFERFYREIRDLTDGTHDLDSVVKDDNVVAVRVTFAGKQHDSPIEIGFADFFTFDDQALITERHTYTDQGAI